MITCISQGLCNCLYINCCKVNDVQTFRTILQNFISMVYNTVSLAQHIIGGPVRDIMGITCCRTGLPINDLPPCTCPAIWGESPICKRPRENPVSFVLFSTRQMLFRLTY